MAYVAVAAGFRRSLAQATPMKAASTRAVATMARTTLESPKP
jgi:hypothetical protein